MEKFLGEEAIKRIAEAYKTHPNEIAEITTDERQLLRQLVNRMFGHYSNFACHFDFTHEDPYEYKLVSEMLPDLSKGILKVNVSGNNSEMWGSFYNLQFRAIHDFIHCEHNLDFNHDDEVKAYVAQLKASKYYFSFVKADFPLYARILRSEIVYQSAYKTYFDVFHLPEQKIILSDL